MTASSLTLKNIIDFLSFFGIVVSINSSTEKNFLFDNYYKVDAYKL